MSVAMQQLMLPLLLAMDATKKGLLAFVQQMGMVALSELLAKEASMIAGPKGQHIAGRTHHHWGTASTPVGFGGRHVSLTYPRVRARGKGRGAEVTLPTIETLRDGDPMTDRVAEQIALGVSTRGYAKSLEPSGSVDRDARREQEQHVARAHRRDDRQARAVRRTQARRRRPRGDVHLPLPSTCRRLLRRSCRR
jgi:hypothetical protein